MDQRFTEIVIAALGAGIFFYLAFELIWEALPHSFLRRIDFKPFNCFICFTAWLSLVYGIFLGYGLLSFAFAGIAALVAFKFNSLF